MKNSCFYGREIEINLIINKWEKARNGIPQIVNIIADTGVGKTRIVHEFYEWLLNDYEKTNGNAKKYWPDSLGSTRQRTVNPSFNSFGQIEIENYKIPWIWWGMYWAEEDHDFECALSKFGKFVEAHMNIVEMQRNIRKKGVALAS